MCRSYSDLNFGVTFWNTVYTAGKEALRSPILLLLLLSVCTIAQSGNE